MQLDIPDNSGKEELLPDVPFRVGVTILLGIPTLLYKSSEPMGTLITIVICEIQNSEVKF